MRIAGHSVGIGFIRAFLAVSVYIWHQGHGIFGLRGLDGQSAVESFFIISGFYIFMILDGTYKNGWLFFSNRLLRLYPGYLAVLIATVIVLGLAQVGAGTWYCLDPKYCGPLYEFAKNGDSINSYTVAFILFSNLSMLFQDVTFYLGIDHFGGMYWTHTFREAQAPYLWMFMGLPQAWSLSVELYFYSLILLIHRCRTSVLVAAILAGVVAKGMIYASGWPDPWGDKFFPVELMMFLLGGLAYRAHRNLPEITSRVTMVTVTGVILVTVLFAYIPGVPLAKTYVYCLLLAGALPVLFRHSGTSRLDRQIGDLSYPIYLTHQTVIFLLPYLFQGGWIDRQGLQPLMGLLITLVSAFAVYRWIDLPVDRFRQRRKLGLARPRVLAESGAY